MYEETGKWLNKMYSTDSFCISFECGEDTEETLEFFKKSTENSFSKNGFVDSKTEADGFSMGTGASWAEVVVYVLAASGFVKSVDEAIEVIKKQGKSLIDFSKSLLGTKKEQEDLLLEDKSEDIQATPEDGRYSLGILKILCLAHLSGKFGEQTKPSTKYIRSNVVYKRDIDLSYMVVNPIYHYSVN